MMATFVHKDHRSSSGGGTDAPGSTNNIMNNHNNNNNNNRNTSKNNQKKKKNPTLEDVAEEMLNGMFCHYEPPRRTTSSSDRNNNKIKKKKKQTKLRESVSPNHHKGILRRDSCFYSTISTNTNSRQTSTSSNSKKERKRKKSNKSVTWSGSVEGPEVLPKVDIIPPTSTSTIPTPPMEPVTEENDQQQNQETNHHPNQHRCNVAVACLDAGIEVGCIPEGHEQSIMSLFQIKTKKGNKKNKNNNNTKKDGVVIVDDNEFFFDDDGNPQKCQQVNQTKATTVLVPSVPNHPPPPSKSERFFPQLCGIRLDCGSGGNGIDDDDIKERGNNIATTSTTEFGTETSLNGKQTGTTSSSSWGGWMQPQQPTPSLPFDSEEEDDDDDDDDEEDDDDEYDDDDTNSILQTDDEGEDQSYLSVVDNDDKENSMMMMLASVPVPVPLGGSGSMKPTIATTATATTTASSALLKKKKKPFLALSPRRRRQHQQNQEEQSQIVKTNTKFNVDPTTPTKNTTTGTTAVSKTTSSRSTTTSTGKKTQQQQQQQQQIPKISMRQLIDHHQRLRPHPETNNKVAAVVGGNSGDGGGGNRSSVISSTSGSSTNVGDNNNHHLLTDHLTTTPTSIASSTFLKRIWPRRKDLNHHNNNPNGQTKLDEKGKKKNNSVGSNINQPTEQPNTSTTATTNTAPTARTNKDLSPLKKNAVIKQKEENSVTHNNNNNNNKTEKDNVNHNSDNNNNNNKEKQDKEDAEKMTPIVPSPRRARSSSRSRSKSPGKKKKNTHQILEVDDWDTSLPNVTANHHPPIPIMTNPSTLMSRRGRQQEMGTTTTITLPPPPPPPPIELKKTKKMSLQNTRTNIAPILDKDDMMERQSFITAYRESTESKIEGVRKRGSSRERSRILSGNRVNKSSSSGGGMEVDPIQSVLNPSQSKKVTTTTTTTLMNHGKSFTSSPPNFDQEDDRLERQSYITASRQDLDPLDQAILSSSKKNRQSRLAPLVTAAVVPEAASMVNPNETKVTRRYSQTNKTAPTTTTPMMTPSLPVPPPPPVPPPQQPKQSAAAVATAIPQQQKERTGFKMGNHDKITDQQQQHPSVAMPFKGRSLGGNTYMVDQGQYHHQQQHQLHQQALYQPHSHPMMGVNGSHKNPRLSGGGTGTTGASDAHYMAQPFLTDPRIVHHLYPDQVPPLQQHQQHQQQQQQQRYYQHYPDQTNTGIMYGPAGMSSYAAYANSLMPPPTHYGTNNSSMYGSGIMDQNLMNFNPSIQQNNMEAAGVAQLSNTEPMNSVNNEASNPKEVVEEEIVVKKNDETTWEERTRLAWERLRSGLMMETTTATTKEAEDDKVVIVEEISQNDAAKLSEVEEKLNETSDMEQQHQSVSGATTSTQSGGGAYQVTEPMLLSPPHSQLMSPPQQRTETQQNHIENNNSEHQLLIQRMKQLSMNPSHPSAPIIPSTSEVNSPMYPIQNGVLLRNPSSVDNKRVSFGHAHERIYHDEVNENISTMSNNPDVSIKKKKVLRGSRYINDVLGKAKLSFGKLGHNRPKSVHILDGLDLNIREGQTLSHSGSTTSESSNLDRRRSTTSNEQPNYTRSRSTSPYKDTAMGTTTTSPSRRSSLKPSSIRNSPHDYRTLNSNSSGTGGILRSDRSVSPLRRPPSFQQYYANAPMPLQQPHPSLSYDSSNNNNMHPVYYDSVMSNNSYNSLDQLGPSIIAPPYYYYSNYVPPVSYGGYPIPYGENNVSATTNDTRSNNYSLADEQAVNAYLYQQRMRGLHPLPEV